LYRFFITIIVLTLALPPAVGFMYDQEWIARKPSFLRETTWLVAFATSLIFFNLYRWSKPRLFVQLYLLSMVVKLLACFAYTVLMILKDREGAVPNAIYFLVIYFVYTALEIAFLYRKISSATRL
jgi:hypothetical protein